MMKPISVQAGELARHPYRPAGLPSTAVRRRISCPRRTLCGSAGRLEAALRNTTEAGLCSAPPGRTEIAATTSTTSMAGAGLQRGTLT